MQTAIKATNMELTDAIRAFVEQKMNALDAKTKRFGEAVRAEVEVGMTSRHHKSGDIFRAEVQLRLPGKKIYVEATHKDLYTAINNAKREAEGQVTAYKGKKESKMKKTARKAGAK
jgi:putative sigma-54 modulation protein